MSALLESPASSDTHAPVAPVHHSGGADGPPLNANTTAQDNAPLFPSIDEVPHLDVVPRVAEQVNADNAPDDTGSFEIPLLNNTVPSFDEVLLGPGANPKLKARGWKRTMKLFAVVVCAALVGSTAVKAFIAESFYVPSGSMKNTLQISDRFFVTRFDEERVARGDIVVFYDSNGWTADSEYELGLRRNPWVRALKMAGIIPSHDNDIMVKRVIGVPGDRIVCCNAYNQLIINGKGTNEKAYLPAGMHASQIRFDVTVPENSLFLMGDNRDNSLDSRYFVNHPAGPFVSKDDVVGRAAATFWPIEHARILRNSPTTPTAQNEASE